ncbi:MAG: hypothetical protein H6667_17365 [Ardenticatenaceae bacterium]|nr:hypothetical protein [Ardenticatenaceae bacterium]MCB9443223.1 hypothetical protein [Ardenticatenaceae bacterium]
MLDEVGKLAQDVTILAEMAGEMEEYLRSDVLFWQLMKGGLPKLTLGGYLMRQHRLLALPKLLTDEEQAVVDTAVAQFNRALVEKIVRLEQKAHQELEARIRQWGEYLKDFRWERGAAVAGYTSAVETRVMMTAVTDKLQMPPYQLNSRITDQIAVLDGNLRSRWRPGSFLWPEAWQPAYPRTDYWYLYGAART